MTGIPANSTENKTFWAKWTAETYSINYELDGGTNHAENPATYTIESGAITPRSPTKSGRIASTAGTKPPISAATP